MYPTKTFRDPATENPQRGIQGPEKLPISIDVEMISRIKADRCLIKAIGMVKMGMRAKYKEMTFFSICPLALQFAGTATEAASNVKN